jgi:uncharacterized protein (DUF1697 family)
MPTFVALLRGINNIGKGKRVLMADLRSLLSRLGYSEVATVVNSGNAVFRASSGTPAEHSANIACAIFTQLKVQVPVIVKSARELQSVLSENPINARADEHSRFLVAFAQDRKALSTLAALQPLVVPPEVFAVGKSAAYMFCVVGIAESKAGRALIGIANKAITTRNLATVLKLHALATPNRSIERTPSGKLRLPADAAHVKR